MTQLDLELARTVAELLLLVLLPMLGRWAVKKNLIQRRWEVMIEAAAATGLNAGLAAGPIGSTECYAAAVRGILGYARAQGMDILKAKRMDDPAAIEAGLARLSNLTSGAMGPAGAAAAGLLPAKSAA